MAPKSPFEVRCVEENTVTCTQVISGWVVGRTDAQLFVPHAGGDTGQLAEFLFQTRIF